MKWALVVVKGKEGIRHPRQRVPHALSLSYSG